LFGHSIGPCGPSGTSEFIGNDAAVMLGCDWGADDNNSPAVGLTGDSNFEYPSNDPRGRTDSKGWKNQQSGTLMHEMGHLLGLKHTGAEEETFATDSEDNGFNAGSNTGFDASVQLTKFSDLPPGRTISAVDLDVIATGSDVRVKVYDEFLGEPFTLLGQSDTITVPSTGIQSFPLNVNAQVPSNGIVWVGFETDSATLELATSTGQPADTTKTATHTFGQGPDPIAITGGSTEGIFMQIQLEEDVLANPDAGLNCVPTYPSIMSYSRQETAWLGSGNFDLDFSRGQLGKLNEAKLVETEGLVSTASPDEQFTIPIGTPHLGDKTFSTGVSTPASSAGSPTAIDWNNQNGAAEDLTGISFNVNDFGIPGCEGSGSSYSDHNDWQSLSFDWRGADGSTFDLAPGGHFILIDETSAISQTFVRLGDFYGAPLNPLEDDGSTVIKLGKKPLRFELLQCNPALEGVIVEGENLCDATGLGDDIFIVDKLVRIKLKQISNTGDDVFIPVVLNLKNHGFMIGNEAFVSEHDLHLHADVDYKKSIEAAGITDFVGFYGIYLDVVGQCDGPAGPDANCVIDPVTEELLLDKREPNENPLRFDICQDDDGNEVPDDQCSDVFIPDSEGEGAPSNGQQYTIKIRLAEKSNHDAPKAIDDLTATQGSVILNWSAPDPNGSPITGYLIERSEDGVSFDTLVPDTGTTATTFTDTDPVPGETNFYRVSAQSALGLAEPSNVVFLLLATEPTVMIVSGPADMASVSPVALIEYTGTAADPGDAGIGPDDIEWTAVGPGAILPETGDTFTRTFPVEGTYTITASIPGAIPDSRQLIVEDQFPTLTITVGPADGATIEPDTMVLYTATTDDPEDGNRDPFIVWTVTGPDTIPSGAGATFTPTFPVVGTYMITATVADTAGNPAMETRELIVSETVSGEGFAVSKNADFSTM
ncbi:MAG: hypothetical protein V3T88_01220, partial [Nitrosomonadaceae bacterium]